MGAKSELLPVATAQKIKESIIQNGMKPGDRLPTEAELGERFEVSRSTLREAMKILKAENVIEIKQGHGTFVSDYTGVPNDPLGLSFTNQKDLISNLLEARLLFEPQIIALAVQRATESDIKALGEIVEKMAGETENSETAMDLDVKFHTAIASCTQNDVLIRIVPIINESIRQGRCETSQVPGSYERAKICHKGMYQAIVEKDIMAAKYYAERHIWETLKDVNKTEGM